MDWTNRFNYGDKDVGLGSNNLLSSLKTHFQEYFITGKTDDGIIDLKLDIIGDETLTADSDVTDHYVESNIAYQDQISLKPKIYTVNGEVGELVWYQRDSVSQAIGQVAQRLEGIISFLPIRSKSFNQMKTKAMKAAQWVDTASNAVSKLSNLYSRLTGSDEQGLGIFETQTNQQQAYIYLLQFRDNRQVISLKTPWGILKNYVITNIKFTQPKETKDKSIISITFKEFRITSVSKVAFDASKYQGNAVYENAPEVDNGKTSGEDKSISEKASEVEDMSLDLSNNINPDDDVWVQENEGFACSYSYEKDELSFYKKENGKWTTEIGDDVFESRVLESCQEKILSQIGS